ncbi:CGNR zinc finger domain-containing protein [Burkholderia perseverans]|uniref:CGNR zinc finger domain-containing protein n=1 Tax=Burkholderia perseverans TaxID=2615214 RepID=UPI001FEE36D8|nr:ABATE domain-containing protein [Burkholderia perseverans]
MSTETSTGAQPVLFVGDNLALDFINTAYGVGDGRCDHLTSDASVIEWLRQAGALPDDHREAAPPGLLAAALELRTAARQLVEKRQAGKWGDPAALNHVLGFGSRHLELQWKKGGQPEIVSRQTALHPAATLLPVAEALARLLADVDFTLVRKCECEDCTLMFHDRTKSHRRRWCSMAMCGNRMKVAAYRARQKA